MDIAGQDVLVKHGLSSTVLDGRYTLRMAALAFRTHRRTLDLAIRVLREQAAAVGVA